MDVYVIENPVFDKNKENNKNVANWKNEVCNRFVFTIKLGSMFDKTQPLLHRLHQITKKTRINKMNYLITCK